MYGILNLLLGFGIRSCWNNNGSYITGVKPLTIFSILVKKRLCIIFAIFAGLNGKSRGCNAPVDIALNKPLVDASLRQ